MRYVRFAILYVFMAVALFLLSNPQKISASFERQEVYNCVFLSDTLAIPDDGSWLPICLFDPSTHLVDLWNYSSDSESPNASLAYSIVSVSDSRCGISLDSHWVNANPQMNWIGSCYVTVRANDSIKTATGGFWIRVLQIHSRIFLPVILND